MAIEELRRRFERDWAASIAAAVGKTPPLRAEWKDIDSIASVISAFAGPNRNHAHLPTGGGMDVHAVEVSAYEDDCLELEVSERLIYLVKPKRLQFEYIPGAPHESFLLLDLEKLEPTGIYERTEDQEELLQLDDGEYLDREIWERGYLGHNERGHEIPIPDSARLVVRWLGGKILFVAKGSLWNGTPQTYDGRHNRMTAEQIRDVILRSMSR